MDAGTYIETARSPAAATPVPPQPAAPARAVSRPCVWKLPHHPAAAGTARRITSTVLDGWDVAEETIDQALLVVSELVTNAVEHARPPVALHLQRPGNDGVLRIEVGDGGPADHEGTWTTSCAPEERGRGPGHHRSSGMRLRHPRPGSHRHPLGSPAGRRLTTQPRARPLTR
ncbi:ATP-binding protein [Streptomyces sp. NBC_01343]|uniref:ATP-binding protein n=1 Tax=Streptomyces sp. NBC_01343 TaxID=2903832 RepID=UPI002E151A5F|nr:ATP-binding protein [Streptomyces sp. NBC_01343]